MQEVAIIGAGELGGAVAHTLARRDLARTIRLIDDHAKVAAGKALDIAQSAPVEGFATQLAGDSDISYAARAAVVVVADGFKTGEWQGDDALALVKRVTQMAPNAIVVCAGTHAAPIVDRCVRELRMPRATVIGSAPEALAGGARAIVALAVNGSPRDVSLTVLGVPPAHVVIPWQDATFSGLALSRWLDDAARRRIEMTIPALWPAGPYALAAAAAKVVAAIGGRSRSLASAFVAPDVTERARRRTSAVPVRLGPAGIVDVVQPALSVIDQIALDNAIAL